MISEDNGNKKPEEVISLANNEQNSNTENKFEKLDLSSEQKAAIEKILVMNDNEISKMMKGQKKGLAKYFNLPNTVFAMATVIFCLLSVAFISVVKSPAHKNFPRFEMAHMSEEKMFHEKHFPFHERKAFAHKHNPEHKNFECEKDCEKMYRNPKEDSHKEHKFDEHGPKEYFEPKNEFKENGQKGQEKITNESKENA